MSVSRLLPMVAFTVLSFSANGQNLDCVSGGSHYEENLCLGKRVKNLDDELNRVYKLAPAAIPENNAQDTRKDREQLRKSQSAWLTDVGENCALKGGLQGGFNSWVSTLDGLCEEQEFNSRIAFLKSVAEGPNVRSGKGMENR